MARRKRRRATQAPSDPFEKLQQLTPRLVGSVGEQVADIESRRAQAMFVVVDPDEVVGLREVLQRQKSGHDFDVVSRCGVGIPADDQTSPIALIDIAFSEVDLAIEIAIAADEYRHSLLEAIRSRQLLIMDAETSIALQSMPTRDAFAKGLSMYVPLGDTKPLVGLLQQRVDLPLPSYRPVAIELDDENRPEAVDRFISGAAIPDRIAIQYRETATPSIIVADADLPPRPPDYSNDAPLDGRWGAMAGDTKTAVRLDVFHKGEHFFSWIVPEPDARIVRAAASGSHQVMLMREAPSDDQQVAEKQWAEGISVWVEHVEAMRALLLKLQ